jgi:hypothetical protein
VASASVSALVSVSPALLWRLVLALLASGFAVLASRASAWLVLEFQAAALLSGP